MTNVLPSTKLAMYRFCFMKHDGCFNKILHFIFINNELLYFKFQKQMSNYYNISFKKVVMNIHYSHSANHIHFVSSLYLTVSFYKKIKWLLIITNVEMPSTTNICIQPIYVS